MSTPLSPGTRLGHYEICSKIGAGGMGEIYLAEDARLRRKVALKILPPSLVADQNRMRRFNQEAKAAATLNHPHIAHVYEIGESEDVHFIAMEYIEGHTLREKIHDERTELRKLLRYLQQVAEGLAKAHAAGIVHRDLKPDNIMITRDGHAKILDFGLAKLIEPPIQTSLSGDTDSNASTAILQQLSTPGMILGTVGYMSPEQAQGKTNEIDHRSDIFSFGCIVFEAVTGQRAFEGKDALDSLHKIVHAPIPRIKDFSADAPDELQRIVRRCLAKDAEDRYQTIKDVAIELKELRRELELGVDATATPTSGSETTKISNFESDFETKRGQTAAKTSPPTSLSTHISSAEYLVSGIKQYKVAMAVIAGIMLLALAVGVIGISAYLKSSNSETAIESVAVLPFDNLNHDPDTEYLSDGLTESIINSLTQVPNLRVIARGSAFRYKGRNADPMTAGHELGVRAVLMGRLLQRGDNLTVSAELVDVRDNKQLWGEQYERKVSDLMTVQREIAREISGSLRLKLPGRSRAA